MPSSTGQPENPSAAPTSEIDRILGELQRRAQVEERAFTSQAPVVGPLIVRFRQVWNSISTRWYVLPLIQQQNEFNLLVVQQLQLTRAVLDELSERLVADDRDVTALAHDLGKLTYAFIRLEQRLAEAAPRSADAQTPDSESPCA